MILCILLSGVPPFWGESEQQIFDCILKGNLDFQSDPWPQISSEAKVCVKQMLQQVSNSAAVALSALSTVPPAAVKFSCNLLKMALIISLMML